MGLIKKTVRNKQKMREKKLRILRKSKNYKNSTTILYMTMLFCVFKEIIGVQRINSKRQIFFRVINQKKLRNFQLEEKNNSRNVKINNNDFLQEKKKRNKFDNKDFTQSSFIDNILVGTDQNLNFEKENPRKSNIKSFKTLKPKTDIKKLSKRNYFIFRSKGHPKKKLKLFQAEGDIYKNKYKPLTQKNVQSKPQESLSNLQIIIKNLKNQSNQISNKKELVNIFSEEERNLENHKKRLANKNFEIPSPDKETERFELKSKTNTKIKNLMEKIIIKPKHEKQKLDLRRAQNELRMSLLEISRSQQKKSNSKKNFSIFGRVYRKLPDRSQKRNQKNLLQKKYALKRKSSEFQDAEKYFLNVLDKSENKNNLTKNKKINAIQNSQSKDGIEFREEKGNGKGFSSSKRSFFQTNEILLKK